jgi:hypothetical protein
VNFFCALQPVKNFRFLSRSQLRSFVSLCACDRPFVAVGASIVFIADSNDKKHEPINESRQIASFLFSTISVNIIAGHQPGYLPTTIAREICDASINLFLIAIVVGHHKLSDPPSHKDGGYAQQCHLSQS